MLSVKCLYNKHIGSNTITTLAESPTDQKLIKLHWVCNAVVTRGD